MADANQLLLKLQVEGIEKAKFLKDQLSAISTEIKKLDLQQRQGIISSAELTKKTDEFALAVYQSNVAEKEQIKIFSQVFLAQERAGNGFRSMSGSLKELSATTLNLQKSTNTANQTLIGLSQGMQDASQFSMGFNQGLRGIANNIQQTSQMFALLSMQAGSATGALASLWTSLASPAGALIGLAAVTTAMQIIPGLINEATKELNSFNLEAEIAGRKFRSMGFGLESRAQYQIGGFSDKKLQSEKGYYVTQAGFIDEQIQKYEKLAAKIKDKNDQSDKDKKDLEIIETNLKNFNFQLDAQLRYIKAINDEQKKREKDSSGDAYANRPSKMDFTYASKGTITKLRDVNDLEKIKNSDPFALIGLPNGMVKFAKDVTFLEFDLSRPLKGTNQKDANSDWMNPINEKDLKDSAHQYDMLLFDPIEQGFSDINSAIRTRLFGTLDDLKEKFGAVGASIIQSLQSVIAKLIETAVFAAIVSFATGGAVGFMTVFTLLSMGASAGDIIADQTSSVDEKASGGTLGDGLTMVGEQGAEMIYKRGNNAYVYNNKQTNRMASNMMGSQGMQKLQVQVVGKYKGGDIWLANRNHEFVENSSKI